MAQITKQNFFEEAAKFIAALPPNERKALPTIEDGSPNFLSWRQYFERHLGWTPHVLKLLLGKRLKAMTVPTKVPAWFDPTYVEDPNWRPFVAHVTPRHLRPALKVIPRRDTPYRKPKDYSEMGRKDEPEIELVLSPALLKTELVTRTNKPARDDGMEPL